MSTENTSDATSAGDFKKKLANSIKNQLGDQNRFKPNYVPPVQEETQPQIEEAPVQPPTTSTPASQGEGNSEATVTSSEVEDSPSTEVVVDADGNEVIVEYVYDESLAEGEERVEYVEVDDTTDTSADDTSSELESGLFYMDPSNPKGTVYKTADEAKRGIRQKDEYIAKLEGQLSSSDQLKDTLDMYSSFMPPEALKEMVINSYMPEEFQGIAEDEITEPEQLKLLRKARIDAELKLERELAEINNSQVEAEKAAIKRQQDAVSYMEKVESDNFFGIQNPEDRDRLYGILNANVDGLDANASTIALALHEAFGPGVVEDYLLGLKSRFWKDTQQKVKRKVKRIITRPKTIAAPEKPQPTAPRSTSVKGKLVNALRARGSQ